MIHIEDLPNWAGPYSCLRRPLWLFEHQSCTFRISTHLRIAYCSYRIPFLLEGDPEGYQWYPIHDNLGEPLSNPNPSSILGALSNFLNYLIIECNWTLERVHLFGFGQGGTVAVELARKCWTETTSGITSELTEKNCLASVVTISGPLLSYPSFNPCPTPLLIVHRPITESTSLKSTDIRALKKGFGGPGGGMEGKVVEEKLGAHREGMPASQEEWFTVMRFWADVLRQRITGEGIYHIN